jgi:CheY-like chemotaxis protein
MPQVILVADDDPDDVFLLSRACLTAGLPHRVLTVRDGQEAISYLAGELNYVDRFRFPLPTLLVLDLNLPRRNGFEVVSWVRSQEQFQDLPVAIISSSERPEDLQRARELGADDYRIKPAGLPGWVTIVKDLASRWLGDYPESRRSVKRREVAVPLPKDPVIQEPEVSTATKSAAAS